MATNASVLDLTSSSNTVSEPAHTVKLPKSTLLAGKHFVITGSWITMSSEQARELCRANGGRVSASVSGKTDHVVIGGRGTRQDTSKLTQQGAHMLTEKQFLDLILDSTGSDNQSTAPVTGQKRSAEEAALEPSKKARKSDPGPGAATSARKMEQVTAFLYNGYIEMKGKSLIAYDCGGQVHKFQRGKGPIELLEKFEDWLESCDGDYHRIM